ncbi:Glycosyltransferase involved in cell wall bisynthesis [Desulfurobacterium pacificum]|uniref:Glycosyltransferase involved in cell wall bisynthesis n=1 Tax=Desulfurobacterium pacificum TaxID=240166 RepID=A0ABY1NL94_9BACT|nr:glycosyltransferase [Desulfurobacterium pacificum]SMP11956.1 Glycosyltransferase involved in cell wall bisynthesis [Desulfurobacterium pacificum]
MKRTLIVLDELWDSALTDLGIKVASVCSGEVACAVVKGSAAHRKCLEKGIKLYFIENPRKTLPFKPFLSLKKAVSSFKPDVVLTIRGDEMLFASLLKKSFKFRLYRLHGEAKGIKNNALNRYLHRKFVDGVILSSRKLLNEVVSEVRKVFIPGAVDTDKFNFSKEGKDRIRRELGIGDEILLGIIGRLDTVKGHDLFLKSLAALKKELPVKGLIIGEEKNVKLYDLKNLAKKLGIENDVTFITERVSSISDYMSACDVGVVSSKGSEMIARVPLEFMSCGTPVVATNVGVLPEVVNSKTGVCVEAFAESIAEGVRRLVRERMWESRDEIRKEVCFRFSLDALGRTVNDFLV